MTIESSSPPAVAPTRHISAPVRIGVVASLLFLGAGFGFFYAWVCSTMWGLDSADPRVAIAAMQAMNASVRNFVFLPVFFGTPIIVLVTAGLAWHAGSRRPALGLALAGVISLLGGVIFTTVMNVPLNDALATVTVPTDLETARQIWSDYSATWQSRNVTRTVLTGIALAVAAVAALELRPLSRSVPAPAQR